MNKVKKLAQKREAYFMKLVLSVLFFLGVLSILSCSSKKDSEKEFQKEVISDKKIEANIKSLLQGCEVKLSELNNSQLSYSEDSIKLNEQLAGFSGSTHIVARLRGVLLQNNKVLTSLKVYYGSGKKTFDTYSVLFDGTAKKMLNSVLIGSRMDVISIVKKDAEGSLVEIDALVREPGKPASSIKQFTIGVSADSIALK